MIRWLLCTVTYGGFSCIGVVQAPIRDVLTAAKATRDTSHASHAESSRSSMHILKHPKRFPEAPHGLLHDIMKYDGDEIL